MQRANPEAIHVSMGSNLVVALGLSADAFAVSVGRGAKLPVRSILKALNTGLVFGGIEAGMVLAGYLLASGFAGLVTAVDHWIALLLLAGVGGHMILEGIGGEEGEDELPGRPTTALGTVVAAIGTSIDGAAIGVTFAFIDVEIWPAVLTVGIVSATMSTLGFVIGPRVGALFGRRAEIAGGLLLLGIGVWIWYSHVAAG